MPFWRCWVSSCSTPRRQSDSSFYVFGSPTPETDCSPSAVLRRTSTETFTSTTSDESSPSDETLKPAAAPSDVRWMDVKSGHATAGGVTDSTSVELRDVSLTSQVGKGGYADVWRGVWMGSVVAVKVFRTPSDEQLHKVRKEAALLRSLRHPNICSFYGTCSVPPIGIEAAMGGRPAHGIVLEYLAGGTLDAALGFYDPRREGDGAAHAAISSEVLLQLAQDVASGLHFLHSHSIIHCDVKHSNVLLELPLVDSSALPRAKLCDFGISVLRLDEPADDAGVASKRVSLGTTRYQAPEVTHALVSAAIMEVDVLASHDPASHDPLERSDVRPPLLSWLSPAMDVYSFGLLLYEITHGRVAFGNLNAIMACMRASKGGRPDLLMQQQRPELSHLHPLIVSCWDTQPANRPTMHAVLEALVGERRAE